MKQQNIDHKTLLPKRQSTSKTSKTRSNPEHKHEGKRKDSPPQRKRAQNSMATGSRGLLDGSILDADESMIAPTGGPDATFQSSMASLRSSADAGAETALRATHGSVASLGTRGGPSIGLMQPTDEAKLGGGTAAQGAAPTIGLAGAGGARGMDISSFTKRNVRALAKQEVQQTGSGEGEEAADALLQGLESNVRQALLRKRAEYDAEKQKTTKLKSERDRLRLRFRDLQADLGALGVGQSGHSAKQPRAQRMQPFKSVSGKPMYVERSGLSKLESNLE